MELLQLNLQIGRGRERECAEFLRGQLPESHWPILAALAAEVVALHEQKTGATVVLVTGSSQAERVLADLRRDQPALPVKV